MAYLYNYTEMNSMTDTLVDAETGRRTWHDPNLTDAEIKALVSARNASWQIYTAADDITGKCSAILAGNLDADVKDMYIKKIADGNDLIDFWQAKIKICLPESEAGEETDASRNDKSDLV